ncbi:ubiquitin-related domain-containing protein [Apiospora saccharicola]|uniref:Ubiquitin-related domain-containing protein n=1 Tax=Apiospora saccharicola TaxID=335842 RepID=A0ABR1VN09_9PEZI
MSGERVDQFLQRIKAEQSNKDKNNGNEDDSGNNVITIKFKDSARYQNETPWKVKRTDNLWTHLQNYVQSIKAINVPFPGPLRFVTFDGEVINKNHTPESLEMEDGDVVDMMQEQLGGKPCLRQI